jgi:hypothetical protein
MPHNSYIHGGPSDPTAWLPGYVVLQVDWQSIDQLLFESINGDLGGTWAPAAPIVIGGAGLNLTGLFEVSGLGSAEFNGVAVTFDATSTVLFDNGFDTNLGSTSTVGDLNVNGAQFTVAAESFFNNDILVTANNNFTMATGTGVADFFSGSVTISSAGGFQVGGGVTADFGGPATFVATTFNAAVGFAATSATTFTSGSTLGGTVAASLVINGSMSFNSGGTLGIAAGAEILLDGLIRPGGSGRMRKRTITTANADATYGVNDADEFLIPPLGADRTYTLTDTGAGAGDRVRFNALANTTANNAAIAYGARTWFMRNQTGQIVFLEFIFDGSAWRTNDGVVQSALWDG